MRSSAQYTAEEKKERLIQALEQRRVLPGQLSFGQEALWFEEQRTTGSSVYNISLALRIWSPLDIPALQQTFDKLVLRHDQLRTRFPTREGVPYSLTEREISECFEIVSAENLDEEEIGVRVNQDAQAPFDLEQGPLIRARLYSRAEADHILLVAVHHLVADGWSLWLLLDELQALYSAAIAGNLVLQEPPEASYQEFVSWQRRSAFEDRWRRHESFWRDLLAEKPPPLQLHTDRPRPAKLSYRGAAVRFELEPSLVKPLRQLALAENITLTSLLMAAFQALLFRLTHQEDLVVGLPSVGRGLTRFAGVVGYFVNPLPIRGQLSRGLSFLNLMRQVHQRIQEALVHQDYPFPLIVRAMQLERDPSRLPLFETAFVYHKPQPREMRLVDSQGKDHLLQWGSWDAELYQLDQVTSIYDLSLQVAERGDGLLAEMEYNTDLFDRETIQPLTVYLKTLLAAVIDDPTIPVGRLPLLSDEQLEKILYQWNQTSVARPTDKCIHQLIEEQVSRTPESIAATYQGVPWSYERLNSKANQIAYLLLDNGLEPGDIVGVHLPRSVEYLYTVLAILKCGGAFLPLEVSLPRDRLAFLIADSGTRLVITEVSESRDFSDLVPKLISLEEEQEAIAAQPVANPSKTIAPDHTAYVVYTSGTTGLPKGVLVTHNSVINTLADFMRRMEVQPGDTWLAQVTISFDASMVELFLPLIAGASITIADESDSVDGYRLIELLKESDASLIISAPAFWNLVLASGWKGREGLRALCGGDRVLRSLTNDMIDRGVEFYCVYGPTETSICCTTIEVPRGSGPVSIGRPMANNQTYILDEDLQPVPVGVPGELYISGDAVTLGYLHRPGLTAESFIPDPFGTTPGARLYRTGDLARYNRDGTIDFIGRVDSQVKIRGYRIELGEIESQLNMHSEVRTSAAAVRERESGDLQLVAFIQPEDEKGVTPDEIRDHLSNSLPHYMIPSSLVILDALPRLSSGKVDLRALWEFPDESLSLKREFVAPRTKSERALARRMAEVLEIDKVGVNDNFFELGGHSLLAMKFLVLVEAETNRRLAMAEFLRNPTIRHTAALLSEADEHGISDRIPHRTSGAEGSTYPLTQGQKALWFVEQSEPDINLYGLPSAWLLRGKLNRAALEQALRVLISRHDVLRSRIRAEHDLLWEIDSPDAFHLEWLDLSNQHHESRYQSPAQAITRLTERPFDLQSEIPLRVTIVKLGSEEHLLILVSHHIVLDGWSIGIILEELSSLYASFSQGLAEELPEVECYFGDYAVWQQKLLEDGGLEHELSYWREKLLNLPPLELSHLMRSRIRREKETGIVRHLISPDLIDSIRRLGQTYEASFFATVMAAFVVWLYRHTYQDEFGIGFPSSGRLQPEVGRVVGYFVNTLVLRADIQKADTFVELLRRVRDNLLEALDNQAAPFEKVVELVRPERVTGRNPLFQVLFTTEMDAPPFLALDGLVAEEVSRYNFPGQFDLVLNIRQTDEGVYAEIAFDRALFEEATVERLVGRYVRLLESLATEPEMSIGLLEIFPKKERRQILVDRNQTGQAYPINQCVHQLFEGQAAINPSATALTFADAHWSYGELNAWANRLARHLGTLGVVPGDVVGVHLARSPEFIGAILAVMKVGGIYMPLDPNLPEARLRFMVEDSGAAAVISKTEFGWLSSLPDLSICSIEDLAGRIDDYPDEGSDLPVDSTFAAYLIYTSGSSGEPKGVLVSHRSLVNVLFDMRRRLDASPQDVMLSHITIAFDASVAEILLPLIIGASLHLVELGRESDSYYLIETLKSGGATLMHATPANWKLLLDAGWQDGAGMRAFCGGQTLHRSLANRLLERGVQPINAYGPTEATVMCVGQLVTAGSDEIPIGRPISNVSVYVLDSWLVPVPDGVPGEIYIGGDALALGYINRPDLTAEQFIPDPFGENPGSRLYRTGDLGRFTAGGVLEFIGRLDRQVKVRGYRIELGEIESHLHQHESISQTAVEIRQAPAGDRRLVAYVVFKEHKKVNDHALRRYLEVALPQYMIPSTFVPIKSMPLTPNRKVDRKALPDPDWGMEAASKASRKPRSDTEMKLAAIWGEMLHVPEVGADDDFFDLGGHSLLVIQMMRRLEQEFGRRLPLAPFLQNATIEFLAQELERDQVPEGYPTTVSVREAGRMKPLFLITAGYDDIVSLTNLARHMNPDRPVHVLQPASIGQQLDLEISLEDLLAAYHAAIQTKVADRPYLLGGFCSGGLVAMALAQQLRQRGEEVEQLILMDTPVEYPRSQHAIHRAARWFLSRVLRSENPGIPRRTALSGPLFSDAGLVIHLNALSGYKAGDYPGRLALILAQESHIKAAANAARWQQVVSGEFRTITVPGDHDNFARGDRAINLAKTIEDLIW